MLYPQFYPRLSFAVVRFAVPPAQKLFFSLIHDAHGKGDHKRSNVRVIAPLLSKL
jgi:hypothetical protein